MSARKSKDGGRRRSRTKVAWGLFLLAVVGVLFFATRYRLVVVIGESMRPTWRSGDLVLVDRWAYTRRSPRESEVVVARLGNELILKRVIALPGQTVELKDGVVRVDGVERVPDYPVVSGDMDIERGTLATDKYAILGDNRARQAMPTVHAVVARTEIVGQAVGTLRWWPGRWRFRGAST